MTDHLTNEEIRRFQSQSLAPDELLQIDDHLTTCAACRSRMAENQPLWAGYIGLRNDLSEAAAGQPEHLPHQMLTAYLDNTLDEFDRELVQSHLKMCSPCTADLEDLRVFRAEMSTYPSRAYRPTAKPTLRKQLRAWWRLPAIHAPVYAFGGAALMACLLFTSAVGPFQVAAPRPAAAMPMPQGNQQSETLPNLNSESQVTALQARLADLEQENAGLRYQNQLAKQQLEAATASLRELQDRLTQSPKNKR